MRSDPSSASQDLLQGLLRSESEDVKLSLD